MVQNLLLEAVRHLPINLRWSSADPRSPAGTLDTGETRPCLQVFSLLRVSNHNKQRFKAQALAREDEDQNAENAQMLLSNQAKDIVMMTTSALGKSDTD